MRDFKALHTVHHFVTSESLDLKSVHREKAKIVTKNSVFDWILE